jgi:hypothetical protein
MKCPQCRSLMELIEVYGLLDEDSDWQICAYRCLLCDRVLEPVIRTEMAWLPDVPVLVRDSKHKRAGRRAGRFLGALWQCLRIGRNRTRVAAVDADSVTQALPRRESKGQQRGRSELPGHRTTR